MEEGTESAGNRTGRSVADHAAIDFHHGHDLCGGPGEEAFVGDVDVVLCQGDLATGMPSARASSSPRAGDAFEDPGFIGRGL